jgi:hypothetical protein
MLKVEGTESSGLSRFVISVLSSSCCVLLYQSSTCVGRQCAENSRNLHTWITSRTDNRSHLVAGGLQKRCQTFVSRGAGKTGVFAPGSLPRRPSISPCCCMVTTAVALQPRAGDVRVFLNLGLGVGGRKEEQGEKPSLTGKADPPGGTSYATCSRINLPILSIACCPSGRMGANRCHT